jgi:hypothetical protein
MYCYALYNRDIILFIYLFIYLLIYVGTDCLTTLTAAPTTCGAYYPHVAPKNSKELEII